MRRLLSLTTALILSTTGLFAQPATPESGVRWVINSDGSDEFESDEFDNSKWYNADPRSWRGRFPGLFTSEAVSQSDGKLHITVDQFKEPVEFKGQMWTHQGGHVYSKKPLLPGSFVECSMKANKTFMSSTFWLITGRSDRKGCERRTTELDIQECIGYPFDHDKTTQMGSNTHSRGIAKGCDIPAGSKGNHCKVDGKVYDDFHTYGAWWRSPSEILFYLDSEYQYTVNPVAPFDLPMDIKMVCETYNWSVAPEDGGMTGSKEDRTTSYDWVRSYRSIPVEQRQSKADEAANAILETSVTFADGYAKELSSDNPKLGVIYSSAKGGKITLQLNDASGKSVAKTKVTVYSGVGNIPLELNISKLTAGRYEVIAQFGKLTHKEKITIE